MWVAVSGRVKTQKQLAPAAGTLIFSRATMGHLHRNKNKSLPTTQVGQGGRGGGGGYSATGVPKCMESLFLGSFVCRQKYLNLNYSIGINQWAVLRYFRASPPALRAGGGVRAGRMAWPLLVQLNENGWHLVAPSGGTFSYYF